MRNRVAFDRESVEKFPMIGFALVHVAQVVATRKDELAKAQWSEFDDAAKPTVFTVPTARSR